MNTQHFPPPPESHELGVGHLPPRPGKHKLVAGPIPTDLVAVDTVRAVPELEGRALFQILRSNVRALKTECQEHCVKLPYLVSVRSPNFHLSGQHGQGGCSYAPLIFIGNNLVL
jgi:hypothetical protein